MSLNPMDLHDLLQGYRLSSHDGSDEVGEVGLFSITSILNTLATKLLSVNMGGGF
jgi:hypothetical protein